MSEAQNAAPYRPDSFFSLTVSFKDATLCCLRMWSIRAYYVRNGNEMGNEKGSDTKCDLGL